ncbi:M1 family metallopeptidase, partial [Escherichia coli]|nr:M1 family metallopeptidase [Escherichia coli]
ENPLMYVENQQYIHYNKGALVLYAMSDYLGERKFNNILKSFVEKTAFQEAPYTTSIEFVEHLKASTPPHLQYLIRDMLETITLYDNRVE